MLCWTAETVSGFGTYVTTLAVQVLVVVTPDAGAAGVGLVNAARWLPYLAFGLVVGVLVDRARRRPVLVVTDLARAGLLVAVPVLAVLGYLSLPVLMVFMAAFGLMPLLNDAASQSFVPRLVPQPLLTPANARLDQSDAVAQASGPALAGGLVAALSAPWAVPLDAASYVVSALLVLRASVEDPARRVLSPRGLRGETTEGPRWVYRSTGIAPSRPTRSVRMPGSCATPPPVRHFRSSRCAASNSALSGSACCSPSLAWVRSPVAPSRSASDLLQGRVNATMRSVNRAMDAVGVPLDTLLTDASRARYTRLARWWRHRRPSD